MVQPARIAPAVVFVADETAAQSSIAGVTAIGRIVREIAEAGLPDIHIVTKAGALGPEAIEDFERLAPGASVRVRKAAPQAEDAVCFASDYLLPADEIVRFLAASEQKLSYRGEPVAWRPASIGGAGIAANALPLDARAGWALLRGTVKPGDGIVSRWLNRRISRPISAFLLLFPFIRPVHATIGTALIGVAMLLALLTGTHWGLVAGALLFQFASIFDGVDGELARVTFRSSRNGAALDSAIDMATNILFIVGLTYSLTVQGVHEALYLGVWSLGAMALGLWLIGRRTMKAGKPLGFDLVKHKMREGKFGPVMRGIVSFFMFLTARDGFAFLFAILVASGLALVALSIFASVALIWIVTVIIAIFPRPTSAEPVEEAASVR